MGEGKIDLHTHSTYSDGTCTPLKLIKLAKASDIRAIALTDHDTLAGVEEARHFATLEGISFIAGVELEIEIEKGEFHLLGLGLKRNIDLFEQTLTSVRNYRNERNLEIIEKMNKAGIDVTLEEVSEIACGEIVARPHFARVLINRKIVKTPDEAFNRFLEKGGRFYSQKKTLTLAHAIGLIKDSGGTPVIAHPFSLLLSWQELMGFLISARNAGLEGIEAFHPQNDGSASSRLSAFALKNGFIVTGGSDFHGENTPGIRLGYVSATRSIPGELAKPFLAASGKA